MPTYKIMVENLDTKVGEILTVYGSGPMAARRNALEMARMMWKTDNVQPVRNWRNHARQANKKAEAQSDNSAQ